MTSASETGQTFELTIGFRCEKIKISVLSWLAEQGIVEFVEGVIDGVDLVASEDIEAVAESLLSDRDSTPIAIYDEAHRLKDLEERILRRFDQEVDTRLVEISTLAWQQAWDVRPDFDGFETQKFVVASHVSHPAKVNDKFGLVIQRGQSFGDGRHATTQVALELLEVVAPVAGGAMLDVGTGSGILAIAAARLGMRPIIATEIDANALQEAQANALASGVPDGIDWRLTEHIPLVHRYDLVCANILVPVLHTLMPDLVAALSSHGRLILAGFIEKDEPALLARALTSGLRLESRASVRGWSGLVFVREALPRD